VETGTWRWIVFGVVFTSLLVLDLVVHRGGRQASVRAAAIWSLIWILAGLGFSGFVFMQGTELGLNYLAAYAMEESLSLDNMFVFLLIFRTLNIPDENQHTSLGWGILGALVFRAGFILLGIEVLEHWDWARYVFGAILLVAAFHAFRSSDLGQERQSGLVQWLARRLPVSTDSRANSFMVRENGKRMMTPLLVALVAIELSDVVFAIDSVPAALGVTRDRFVVYSANAFAILGLRSLYLVGHAYIIRFEHLHYGLCAVLLFAAFKIAAGEHVPVHPLLSVAVIVLCIGLAVLASVVGQRPHSKIGA
jgi:TerC family integral membrane protein